MNIISSNRILKANSLSDIDQSFKFNLVLKYLLLIFISPGYKSVIYVYLPSLSLQEGDLFDQTLYRKNMSTLVLYGTTEGHCWLLYDNTSPL